MSWKLWDGMRRDGVSRDCGGCPSYCFFAVKTIINPLAHPLSRYLGITRIQGGWAAGEWWTGDGGRSDSKVGGGLTRRKSGEQ